MFAWWPGNGNRKLYSPVDVVGKTAGKQLAKCSYTTSQLDQKLPAPLIPQKKFQNLLSLASPLASGLEQFSKCTVHVGFVSKNTQPSLCLF